MLDAEPDEEMSAELDKDVSRLAADIEQFRLRSLLSGPDDCRDAQLEIAAGAGGTEAQDWAAMLMRMYTRWAERKGFAVEILDMSEGEEAGIKGAVLEIKGAYAYGFLKAESGVHRLVRISPFDSQARRHTSFALGVRLSGRRQEINIEIRDEDMQDGRVSRVAAPADSTSTRPAPRSGSRTFPAASWSPRSRSARSSRTRRRR